MLKALNVTKRFGELKAALIAKINQDLGITIIIIEHFMKVLTELTEILMCIESGRMICQDESAKVCNDPRVIECYLGKTDADEITHSVSSGALEI